MKKRYIIICVIMNLFALILIPANLYLFSMPEWISLLLDGLAAAALVFFFLRGRGKWLSKSILTLLLVLTIGVSLFGTYCNPYWNSWNFRLQTFPYSEAYDTELTYEQAKEDLDACLRYLKKDHPLFLNGIPAEIQEQYEEAVEELQQAEHIDVMLVWQKCQNILSVLGEGHTCSYPNLHYMEQHYLKTIQERKDVGDTLTAVNGMELGQLLEEKSDLYCYEVESWGILNLKSDLSTLEGLRFLGLSTEEGIAYTYESPEGKRDTVIYYEEDFVPYDTYMELNQTEDTADGGRSDESDAFVSYMIDPERSLAVLILKECNYNDTYCSCLREMFTEVREQGIEHVAVDIRGNGGGNSLVVNEFIRYLDVDTYRVDTCRWRLGIFNPDSGSGINQNQRYTDLTFQGDVYILTSAGSFSSAMMFAEYIKDNQLGTLIGEAPGNTPSGFGDIAIFQLPNSGLYLNVSTKEFFRADRECKDILVLPDVECDAEDAMERLYQELDP